MRGSYIFRARIKRHCTGYESKKEYDAGNVHPENSEDVEIVEYPFHRSNQAKESCQLLCASLQ